ncbi:hypothetical protein HDV03_002489 [Kappamyces sp. JEL0829]|nr:hypothetical protein HDV03_002489 [Kappamyces sp. JEL0829]
MFQQDSLKGRIDDVKEYCIGLDGILQSLRNSQTHSQSVSLSHLTDCVAKQHHDLLQHNSSLLAGVDQLKHSLQSGVDTILQSHAAIPAPKPVQLVSVSTNTPAASAEAVPDEALPSLDWQNPPPPVQNDTALEQTTTPAIPVPLEVKCEKLESFFTRQPLRRIRTNATVL